MAPAISAPTTKQPTATPATAPLEMSLCDGVLDVEAVVDVILAEVLLEKFSTDDVVV